MSCIRFMVICGIPQIVIHRFRKEPGYEDYKGIHIIHGCGPRADNCITRVELYGRDPFEVYREWLHREYKEMEL